MARQFFDVVTNLFMVIGAVALALMLVQINLDVAGKYLFSHPVPATLEMVTHFYMVAIVFLPIAAIERANGHIKVDLLVQFLPKRVATVLASLMLWAATVYFAALSYRTSFDAIDKLDIGEYVMGTVAIPTWPARFVLPLGCGLTAVLLAYKGWRLLLNDQSVLDREETEED